MSFWLPDRCSPPTFLRQAQWSVASAPLQTPVAATSLIPTTSPSTITYGTMTTIQGRLTAIDGSALAARTVRLYVRQRGTTTWRLLSTRTTAADGTFGGTHGALSNLDYRASFAADGRYAAATRDGRVNVAPAVSVASSATSVRLGGTVTMRGSVTPAHGGETVKRKQFVDGEWITVATATLSSTGTYSFPVKPRHKGTKYYRVVKPADADHVKGRSATVTLRVS